jgi:uroporphyrinogen decarboxylase
MTPRERVWAALRGDPIDRPPISFWGHVYHRESSARDLVEHTLERQERYRWDWVKLNPRKHYHVEPWGVRYRYPGRPDEKPTLEAWPIHSGEDWGRIDPRPHTQGALGEQLDAVRMLRQRLPKDVPMIETVFTPLAILGEMVREPIELKRHLSSHPDAVRTALEAVTATFEPFVAAVLEAGADGIYLATVDWASRDLMTAEEYDTWARPYDLRLLNAAAAAPFNVLHVCRRNTLLPEMANYPVAAVSWDSSAPGNLSLRQAKDQLTAALMGGIAHEGALQRDDGEALLAELHRGFDETGGRRWLVAPSCSIPPTTRPEQLERLRAAVEEIPSPRGR